ncbi:hypothetical protein Bbelb_030820 [Branchiostoma belcheri]|nr:hypothetical protein Bbelb_030820 [Branchiostoma belcheri]
MSHKSDGSQWVQYFHPSLSGAFEEIFEDGSTAELCRFLDFGRKIADFLTWWILEKTRKWRPKDDGVVVGRAEFSQVSCVLRVCQLCKCSCPDEIRLVMTEAPGDRIQSIRPDDIVDDPETRLLLADLNLSV